MIIIQMGIVIFLCTILAIIYQDEYKRRKRERNSAELSSFWGEHQEKRKTVRETADVGVLYEVLSDKQVYKLTSKSRNISLGGMNLAINEKLFPGTALKLQITIDQNSKPILTQGEIAWIKELPLGLRKKKEQRLFAAGIKFIQIKPEDQAAIHAFIQQKRQTAKPKES